MTMRKLAIALLLAGGLGRVLETPTTCTIAVATARMLPRLVTGMAAATRLRGLDLAGSLDGCPGGAVPLKV